MEKKSPIPFVRLSLTSLFMGLANLVPGVSGGTMVLALGLYDDFIGSVADVSRLRIRLRPLVVLGILFGGAALTILLFSSLIQGLMETRLPAMLGLFIGMTLGGAPALWKELQPLRPTSAAAATAGIAVMAVIAFALRPGTIDPNFLFLFIGGIVGSATMILPGVSGSYMLLVLGLYLPIIGGISDIKDALSARDVSLFMAKAVEIALPVGIGVAVGIVALSNLLKFCLDRFHATTLGFLLGLLLGSVLGLYPFKAPTFDKLVRDTVVLEDGTRELRVLAFNVEGVEEDPIYRSLARLEENDVRLRLVPAEGDVDAAAVEQARALEAVLLAYDTPVPRDVRRLASDPPEGTREVELLVVPNTEFFATRAVLVAILIVFGFSITFAASRLSEKPTKPTADTPDNAPTEATA